MSDERLPEFRLQKGTARASGHGRAFTSYRDMANQDITIRESIVVFGARAEETMERVQHSKELLDAIGRLEKQLSVMIEAARRTEERLRQETELARGEGFTQAMIDSLARLQAAELRRREVEERLKQVLKERDEARMLMYEAQRQALDARNKLEEERHKAELDEALTKFRSVADSAPLADEMVYEDTYDRLVASADAELDVFRTQLAQLSTELEEFPRQGLSTMTINSAQQSTSGSWPLLFPVPAIVAQADTGGSASMKPDTGELVSNSGRRLTVKSVLLPLLGLLGFLLDGISINIMVNSSKGPAIFWEIVYAAVAFVVALLYAAMFKTRIFVGLPVLVAAIFFPSPSLPVVGSLGHWLVYHLGPM
jgi:hypothetical protein